jgi:hypothetical protein
MANIEEGNDPDIRSCTRIPHHVAVNNKLSTQVHGRCRDSDHACASSRLVRVLRGFILPLAIAAAIITFVLGVAVTFATGPRGYALSASSSDKARAAAIAAGTRHDPERERERVAPITALLKMAATWVMTTASSALGYDLVPRARGRNGGRLAKREHIKMDGAHIAEACMIPVLVALSGIFAGLTLGYFSVDPTQLQVLSISGTPKQQEYARRILPVR